MAARQEISRDVRIAGAHELPAKRQLGRTLSLMIGQILDCQFGIVDEEFVVRVGGLIGERKVAVSDDEVTHADLYRWPVVLLLNLLAGRFHPLRFCLLSLRCVNIADGNPVDGGVVNLDPGYLGRVFEQAVARQPPSVHCEIDLANLRIERAYWNVLDRVLRAGAGEGLFEKVRVAVDSGAAGVEDHQGRVEAGRVGVVGRVNIADVIGDEVEIREVQRRIHLILDVHDVAVVNSETVDLDRIDSLERVLPSLLPQRNAALLFRHQLRLIDVDLRT